MILSPLVFPGLDMTHFHYLAIIKFKQPEACLLNKSPILAAALCVTKHWFGHKCNEFDHTVVFLKSNLDVQQTQLKLHD